ncbi:hypothetical protein LTR70_005499 [Exophiala xenobiotica]|uniref:Mid2 domain-containing protein n=1 Tax=Lithohypha guttulata TaxID=1690604 RepID=A0ABR0KDT2_9EURO|nr:hypothetical protein LTR24_003866 [Lithohypha guttulata]KAK5318356.1 hypothetical protein LTR70_005499 [Exophiala xenobiotica]
MQPWSLPTFLLFAIISASAVPAREIDAALAKEEKRQVSLSTGVSSTSEAAATTTSEAAAPSSSQPPMSSSDDAPSVTTTVQTAVVTSQGSTVIESTTAVVTPSDVTQATTVVQSTITRTATDAQGKTSQVQETVSSTATSQVTYSYSQFVTSSASQVVETFTSVQGASTVTGVRTSSTLVAVTTSARATPSALAADGNSGGNSGLSSSSKSIIGGVVGGIGGALLLGALGYTAWRIWGKKKNPHDDGLYDPNAQQEKLSTSTDNNQTPFQSTLNQYHNPGPVNTASNF